VVVESVLVFAVPGALAVVLCRFFA
jgi:hypothetical protein